MEVGSGDWDSMMMSEGGWGRVERRRERKRPTQPPPEMRMGRGEEVVVAVVE